VKEGEYGRSTIYLCMKNGTMRTAEAILRGRRVIKEDDGG
jgi:hypothetical protein